MLTFLAGVALLFFVFRLAYDMFTVAPAEAIGAKPGQTLDLNQMVSELGAVVIRVILLLVMAILGGVVANRGIRMFADAGAIRESSKPGESS